MLKRKLGLLVAAAVIVGMFTSCVVNVENDKNKNGGSGDGIDYTNYSDFSIKVRNASNYDVVCFKGVPSDATLISGAHGGGEITGLKKDTSVFSSSGDFVLQVYKVEDYNRLKGNYDELKKAPFALIYAYYNEAATNDKVYEISSHMGGDFYIILNNSTAYNAELREKSPDGVPLAFVGSQTVQTTVYVGRGDYFIYPVFRKFNNKTKEIVTCYPKVKTTSGDKPMYMQFSLRDVDGGQRSMEFNVDEWFDANAFKDSVTPGSAYVAITNGDPQTGICLYKGTGEAETTSTGGKNINATKTLIFEVPMVSTSPNTFAKTALVSGWKVGTAVNRVNVPNITVEAGKMYFLDVAGAGNGYDFTPTWRLATGSETEYETEVVNFDE